MVVLDASAFLSMIFADERTSETPAMERALESGGALVPSVWLLEVQNALLVAERAGRIEPAATAKILASARIANISVDPVGSSLSFGAEFALARTLNLSVYDAAYVELAQRSNIPLMTVDRKLRAAAEALGLVWTKGYSPLVAVPKRSRRKKYRE